MSQRGSSATRARTSRGAPGPWRGRAEGAAVAGGTGDYLSLGARSGNAAKARARGGGIMTWVTWRQHRLEALWALILAGLLAGVTAYTAYELWVASANCPPTIGHGYCLSND